MTIAVCNFIRLKVPGGPYRPFAYQNLFIGESKAYAGITYGFLPFSITNGGGRKGGDRANAALTLNPNPISINVLAEAAESAYLLEVRTVEVDALNLTLLSLITSELWFINSMEHDVEKVQLRLSSPLDAVDGQVPRRVLGSELVGALPTTGRMVMS